MLRVKWKKKSSWLLVLALFFLLSTPFALTEFMRGKASSIFSSLLFWQDEEDPQAQNQEIAAMRVENELLKQELERFRELFHQESLLIQQWITLEANAKESNAFQSLRKNLQRQLKSVPSRVVFRDPNSWSSTLWIDVGDLNNTDGQIMIAENSPVLVDGAVIGVIDLVEKKRSRVRLLSDSSLTPSVRVSRGLQQNLLLYRHVEVLMDALRTRGNLLEEAERELLSQSLARLSSRLLQGKERLLLAKGELCGGAQPLWRSQSFLLKGVGFNYDFSDSEGAARDLRTGKLLDTDSEPLPLIEVGDLLITSGLDGVFPEGLPVAIVSKRNPLREGAFTYEIEAQPVVGRFNDISTVFVIPPLDLR